jgi:L-iditol 2-dehydrogenase
LLAAVYEGIGKLGLKNLPVPRIEEDNLLIKVKACAICGTDVKAFTRGISRITIPVILGHEFVGEIVEVGRKVKDFKIGERVTMATTISCGKCQYCTAGLGNLCNNVLPVGTVTDGAFCEYMAIPAAGIQRGNLLKVPEEITDEEGALSEPLGCVINGQSIAEVKSGDTVVIIGAGPIGCMHIDVARARGATQIIVGQRSETRLKLAAQFNVDVLINSSQEDPVSRVLTLTGGKGADIVIVAAPSNEACEKGLEMLAKGGRLSIFSSLFKNNPYLHLDGNRIHYRQIKVCGASDSTPFHQRMALELLRKGKINTRALITHRFPLSKILSAFDTAVQGKGLKIIIQPEEK